MNPPRLIARHSKLFAPVCGAVLINFAADACATPEEAGTDWFTKPFWSIKNTYRVVFPVDGIRAASANQKCNVAAPTPKIAAGTKSVFVEHKRNEDGTELIGEFNYVSTMGVETTASSPTLGTAYRLCIKEEDVPEWKIRRAGGIDTGVLVIPFKVRSGSLYSDSTVGPYIAGSGSTISLLATFGLTQISTKPRDQSELKEETGLTFALGTIWRVKKDWDIGLVAGIDHLSGDAGRDFRFQNKWWWSFSIGYNFTK